MIPLFCYDNEVEKRCIMELEAFSLAWWGYIVAGLGIFLFGIAFLSDGLKKAAGSKIKSVLDKYASKPIQAALIGAGVTVFIQSSGTTALTIGLIRAGLISLTQATGIIMGANIGTTVTSFIIGLNLSSFAPFVLVIGAFIYLLANRPKLKYVGIIMLGFGMIFFGMTLMESALKPLAQLPEFITLVQRFGETPILGVLVGTVGTAAIQSSSAFIGIIQSLYESSVEYGFTLKIALPLVFGSNIGTTVTAIIAAIGSSREGKKAAAIHVIFNVIGTILFMIFLNPYVDFISWLDSLINMTPRMEIAVAHIIFNVITTAILLPCAPLLVKFVNKILPSKEQPPELAEVNLSLLDRNVLDIMPATALDIAKDQTIVMGGLAIKAIDGVYKYFNEEDIKAKDLVLEIEETLDQFEQKLNVFLTSMEHSSLEPHEINLYGRILKTYRDIERIGDHCENLVQYFEEYFASDNKISDEGRNDINALLKLAKEMLENAMEAFKHRNTFIANIVKEKEGQMDQLNKAARERHVQRIIKNPEAALNYISIVYVDLTGNIERIGDHCNNIADTILGIVSHDRTQN